MTKECKITYFLEWKYSVMLNFNARIYVCNIRRIATKHQTGWPLKEVKRKVDILIQLIIKALGSYKNHQLDQWRLLLDELRIIIITE